MSQTDLAKRVQTWRELLERPDVQSQIAAAIRTKVSPKTIARVTLSNMLRNPRLMECSQASVLQAVMTACALGLEPDGVSGQAYLVPYKDVCTLIPGYRGLIQLAYRSGEVLSIQALNVYAAERFERHVGAIPPVLHIPKPPDARGEYIGSYAVATIKGGGCVCEFMWRQEVDAIRQRSKAKDSGPWVTDYEEMCRKTVVRRLFKYIPSSPSMRQAVAIEDEAEYDQGVFVDAVQVQQGPSTGKAANAAAKLMATLPQSPDQPNPTQTTKPLTMPQDDLDGPNGQPDAESTAQVAAATNLGTDDPCLDLRGEIHALRTAIGVASNEVVAHWQAKAGVAVGACTNPDVLALLLEDLRRRQLELASDRGKAQTRKPAGGLSKTNARGELIPGATSKGF